MSTRVSTDVLQQSLRQTLNQCFVSLISSHTIMTIQSMYAYRWYESINNSAYFEDTDVPGEKRSGNTQILQLLLL